MKKYQARTQGALLCILAAAILTCGAFMNLQSGVAGKVLRLHVVANSDSEEDQALKLGVRDRVLNEVERLAGDGAGLTDARAALAAELDAIETAARDEVAQRGYTYDVTVRLGESGFPGRDYGDFTLPAGVYDALTVEIGEGAGKNWWCVLFPPFCASAAFEEEAREWGMSESEIKFISSDGAYELRFRLLDWIARLGVLIRGS